MKIEEVSALVVDDDSSMANLYSRILSRAGIKDIDVAGNEGDALKLMQENRYDFMMLDTEDITGDYGPRILKKAREIGQNAFVVAVSGDPSNREKWEEIEHYTFYSKGDLKVSTLIDLVKKQFPRIDNI